MIGILVNPCHCAQKGSPFLVTARRFHRRLIWHVAGGVGAILFGGVNVLALRLQVSGVAVPSQFLNMLPYLCTILVLILTTGNFGGKRKSAAPKALGRSYDREAR